MVEPIDINKIKEIIKFDCGNLIEYHIEKINKQILESSKKGEYYFFYSPEKLSKELRDEIAQRFRDKNYNIRTYEKKYSIWPSSFEEYGIVIDWIAEFKNYNSN